MKTLITAIALTLSSTAFAATEQPQYTIPGYGVHPAPAQQSRQANLNITETRTEPLAYTVPGYGVTPTNTGRIYNQTEMGSADGYDYLGMSFDSNQ